MITVLNWPSSVLIIHLLVYYLILSRRNVAYGCVSTSSEQPKLPRQTAILVKTMLPSKTIQFISSRIKGSVAFHTVFCVL